MDDVFPLLPILLPFVLLNELHRLPTSSGIYFAMTDDGDVLYVGVSFNLYERWKQHHQLEALKTLDCKTIAYYLCRVSDFNTLEQAMVTQFKPVLNGPWKPWTGYYERIPLVKRFWPHVNKDTCLGDICGCHKGIGHCWPWTGYHPPGRYGKINVWVNGKWKKQGTNRVAFELVNGPIAEGMLICHYCDNPPCCRPDHLWSGTIAENTLDAYTKGRLLSPCGIGDNHYMKRYPEKLANFLRARRARSKLTQEQVDTIFSLIGTMPYTEIGALFNISASCICEIHLGKIYKPIK